MTKEDEVRMVAGECLVNLTVAEYAIDKCGSPREAIAHLSVQRDPTDWRRDFYGG